MSLKSLNLLLEEGTLPIYQSKINEVRTVSFGEKGLKLISKIFDKNKHIIFRKHDVLFPQPSS